LLVFLRVGSKENDEQLELILKYLNLIEYTNVFC
jgi:hypothetical protein